MTRQLPTHVLYKFNTPDYQELAFVQWTDQFLVVKYPASGKPWRMGRNLILRWIKAGILKVEGYAPEWATAS